MLHRESYKVSPVVTLYNFCRNKGTVARAKARAIEFQSLDSRMLHFADLRRKLRAHTCAVKSPRQ
jgi:hypothetical protein